MNTSIDTYKTLNQIKIDGENYFFYDLNLLCRHFNVDLKRLPYSIKILLENLIRNEDGISITSDLISNFCKSITNPNIDVEIFFHPTRVLMQDFTGVPAIADLAAMREALKLKNIDPQKINPLSRVDLVIDHSVMVDKYGSSKSFEENVEKEFIRNKERYEFLKWGQNTFNNFYLVPPGAGICHQVNLENISKTVWISKINEKNFIFPDSVVGTDSHTTMVNALSVLGWGVGGIEAEAAILGQPISMNKPKIVGYEFTGSLNEGITATDLVLTVTKQLREYGVVGKFVEFYGTGLSSLSLADRATISNMAPEYGATCGFFPTDIETLKYLELSGKNKHHLNIVSEYTNMQKLSLSSDKICNYDENLSINLSDVESSLAGPKRPQDKISLSQVPKSFTSSFDYVKEERENKDDLISGDIVIAAITSCTNTSNPDVMVAAGLLAKKAVELGLKPKSWVKTSLAPGSKVVSDYLQKSRLNEYLDKIGFNLVGYGCTTCIGNSGPLNPKISHEISNKNLTVCSVLSGNRNFEGRVHQEVKANYLASPPLVVAYALAGNININLKEESIGISNDGNKVFLKDIWPTTLEIKKVLNHSLSKDLFIQRYSEIYQGDANWKNIKTNPQKTFKWNEISTYIKHPPFFTEEIKNDNITINKARVLAMLGDSVTTDHISPAGAINPTSPAGQYLLDRQISIKNFNSYGSRRGNHEIMMRGTFANIRIRNELLNDVEGGYTYCYSNNEIKSIYDAAMEYSKNKIPLIIIAGKEYGTGSSRDWAAKGTKLLGVKAVIAESFERIHRSNLIGMGVLPLEFLKGESRKFLNIKGNEEFTFNNIDKLEPSKILECNIIEENKNRQIKILCRIDTLMELKYYRAGGILQYVLNSIVNKK